MELFCFSLSDLFTRKYDIGESDDKVNTDRSVVGVSLRQRRNSFISTIEKLENINPRRITKNDVCNNRQYPLAAPLCISRRVLSKIYVLAKEQFVRKLSWSERQDEEEQWKETVVILLNSYEGRDKKYNTKLLTKIYSFLRGGEDVFLFILVTVVF